MNEEPWVLREEEYESARRLAQGAHQPAVVGNVRTGTAGWTDKTLLEPGLFYPREARVPRARLQFYETQFSVVEVDATYYALLPRSTAESWVAWTQPSFRFDVKAHPVFTGHPIEPTRLPKDLRAQIEPLATGTRHGDGRWLPAEVRAELKRRFLDFVEPLVHAQRLGCVMLQFPPWFEATRGNARRLEALASELPVPLSVEFRHRSWMTPERRGRVLDLLSALGMSYVGVDEPDTLVGGVPDVVAVTRRELALVRLHGRNAAAWKPRSPVSERFNYLYSARELQPWVSKVQQLAQQAENVHVVFNNCVRDFAVLGAKGLTALLSLPEARRQRENS